MKGEGGGRFESYDRRRSPEDPFGRGIESRGNRGPEGEAEEENYWLAHMGVTSEILAEIRRYPALAESSTEYLVYMLLLGKLVEGGSEWDPQIRTRVRNLVGVLRIVGFSNMTEREQAGLDELSKATTFDMRSFQYEVTPDVISDIRWIWRTFGFQVPHGEMGQRILGTPPTRRE